LQRTDTQAGIEAGGGATIWLSNRIGLRTAATYFKALGPDGNFHGPPESGLVYTNVLRDFTLTRVTVGVDIRLSRSNRTQPNEQEESNDVRALVMDLVEGDPSQNTSRRGMAML